MRDMALCVGVLLRRLSPMTAVAMLLTMLTQSGSAQRPSLAPDSTMLRHGHTVGVGLRAPSRLHLDVRPPHAASSSGTHWKRGAIISSVLSAAVMYGLVFDD
jgi:hypothetical protein